MAAVRVEELLAAAEEQEAEKQRSIAVHKELELEFDLGNLLALDRNPPAAAGLRGAARVARLSTASLGRFQPRLPKEPAEPPSRGGGKKRRFAPLLGDLAAERSRQLELLRGMSSKKPPLDITRAVNKQLREEDAEAAATKGKKRAQRGKRGRRQQQRPGHSGKKSGSKRQQRRPASGGGGSRRKKA
nr:ribosome biogenesis regulatory protein homolog [Dromaius novaehollandiae]